MQHAHRTATHRHPHPLADQPPWHRVGIAVHFDGTIGANPPQQIAGTDERRRAGQRTQR
jgi:hypothetical protein